MDYSTSSNDTSYTVSVNSGFESSGWGFSISSGISSTSYVKFNDGSWDSSITGSGGFSSATGATTYKALCSGSKTLTKTHSAQTIYLQGGTKNSSGYMNANLSTSIISISVPAKTSYTVSYNANGGSGVPGNQTKWYDESLTLSSTKPTRTNYTFKGWATSSSGSVAYASGATYTANSAATLYAVWSENTYTVSYNANGGSGAPSSQTKYATSNLTLSSTKPTRSGYNFKGWATSSSGSVAYAAGGTYSSNASVTLYAVWEIAYIASTISAGSAYRCDSSGNASDSGTYFKASFTWKVDTTATSGNSAKTLSIKYSDGSTTKTATLGGTGTGSSSGTTTALVSDISTDSQYTVTFSLTDQTDRTVTRSATVTKAFFVMDFYKDGKGIGLLTAAPSTGVEIADNITVSSDGSSYSSSISEITTNTKLSNGSTRTMTFGTNTVDTYPVIRTVLDGTEKNWFTFSDSSLNTKGGVSANSNMSVQRSTGDTGFTAKRTDVDVACSLYVGSGGVNHGVWSSKQSKWLVNGDASNVYVGGMQVADTIVAQGLTSKGSGGSGTAGRFLWTKWNSGAAEIIYTTTVSTTVNSSWGSLYISSGFTMNLSLPFSFSTTSGRMWPSVSIGVVTTDSSGHGCFGMIEGSGNNYTTLPKTFYIVRGQANTSTLYYNVTVTMRGQWK
jgi:uncharacterized repeat protein (TIGR02543 family)